MANIPLKLEFVETREHPQLVAELRRLLADTIIFYLKAHGYHWNVEGPNFGPFHGFFETIYSEVYGTVDTMAEHLRKLDAYAPHTLVELQKTRSLKDGTVNTGSPIPMVQDLMTANEDILAQIGIVRKEAEAADQSNLANYLDERRDAHQKHAWFLRSTLK
jgi:starvation-inducible DNA-binding protein